MQCIQCNRPFENDDRIASISGGILGDEVTDSYFLCPVCGVYTLVQWWDDFTGEETMALSGPLSRPEGDKRIELIRKCARPWDKKCHCDAHRDYFDDTLD